MNWEKISSDSDAEIDGETIRFHDDHNNWIYISKGCWNELCEKNVTLSYESIQRGLLQAEKIRWK